jgi:hypothetical protein
MTTTTAMSTRGKGVVRHTREGSSAAGLVVVLSVLVLVLGMGVRGCRGTTDWGQHTVIPTRMMGIHLDEELHVARILMSSDDQELRVAIDFASHELIVSVVPNRGRAGSTGSSDPADWSPSYSTMGTQSTDVVRLGDRRYRVPVRYDPQATTHFGCPSCHGILGLGPGSPIWMRWARATFSAGAITLGESLPPVEGDGRPRIECEPVAGEDLCISGAEVYGKPYRVRFRFRSAYTIVPTDVYDEYVGTRSVGGVGIRDWPSLRLRFPSAEAPIDPRNVTLRIRPESLLGTSMRGGAPILLLKRDPDLSSTTITLGRSVWRSLMMHREFTMGRAVITSHHSMKRFPDWAVVVGVIVIILLVRWWMTRDALFHEHIAVERRRNPTRSAVGSPPPIGSSAAAAVRGWVDHQRYGLAQRLKRDGGDFSIMAILFLRAHAPKYVYDIDSGEIRVVHGDRGGTVGGPGTYPGEWGFYPDRLIIEVLAVGGAITMLYIPPVTRMFVGGHLEFWIFLQVLTYASLAWLLLAWFTRLLGQSDVFGILPFRKGSGPKAKIYGVFRVGLVCQATVNVLLCVTLIALASLTRADSLGTIIMALAASLLAGNVMYHLMTGIIHAVRFDYQYSIGRRGEAIWLLWILYGVALYLTTGAFVSAFVLIPMIRIQIVWAAPAHFVAASFVVFIVGLLFSFWLANSEAEHMAEWISRHQNATGKTTTTKNKAIRTPREQERENIHLLRKRNLMLPTTTAAPSRGF